MLTSDRLGPALTVSYVDTADSHGNHGHMLIEPGEVIWISGHQRQPVC